jgi:hypothetical protein
MACDNCGFRAKYESSPKSFLGRLWKFHTKFCPGWKKYIHSLSEEDRNALLERLNMQK